MSEPRRTSTMFADGAPAQPSFEVSPREAAGSTPADGSPVAAAIRVASRVRSIEGWRGYSNRAVVAIRQTGAVVLVAACYLLVRWCFAGHPSMRFGAEVMLFAVATMMVTAAIGTVLYAESRFTVLEQCRHFVYGIVLFPATVLAVLIKIIAVSVAGVTDSYFTGMLLGNGLPLIFFTATLIPPVVFIKAIFGGLRATNRRALADEEVMAKYLRMDGGNR